MRKLLPIILIAAACAVGIFAGLRLVQKRSEMTGPSLSVTFLGPERGGGIIVRTPEGAVLVIDPGPEESGKYLAAYLAENGIRKAAVLVSNPTRERAGALERLIKSGRISMLYHGEHPVRYSQWTRSLEAAKQKGVQDIALKGGDKLKLSASSRLEVLCPNSDEDSLVVRIVYGRGSFLFTSDIDLRAEASLIQSGLKLQSDVMTVPRGGRQGAASLEFLSVVRPEICVVNVRRNREPAKSVLERLDTQNTGADVFRTDERGAVTIKTNGRSIAVDTQEDDRG